MFHPSLEAAAQPDWAARHSALTRNGFVVLDKFIDSSTADVLTVELNRMHHRSDTATYGLVRNARGDVVVMNRLDRESDLLFDFARHPLMLRTAEALLGKPPVSLHVEYFAKAPGTSDPAPAHQDHVFYQEHFDDELALSIWIALDDVVERSGALEYGVPVETTLRPHIPSPTVDFIYELADPSRYHFVRAPVPRGGCVIHHSFAVHRAGRNETGEPRRAVVFNYRGSPHREWLRSRDA